jgi:hypothetical protein
MQITEYLLEPEMLAKELVAFVDGAGLETRSDKYWTQAIKAGLRKLVARAEIEPLLTDPSNGVSEFMLDFVAWSRAGGEGIVLAAESEWIGVMRNSKSYANEVAADFWKLLCVKSPLKLMIFASEAKDYPPEPILSKLKEAFEAYRHHVPGERYIFIDFGPGAARQAFYVKVPETARVHVEFIHIPIDLRRLCTSSATLA